MSVPASDRRIVLWVLAVMFSLVTLTAVLAPNTADEDTQPTTYNTGAQGWKGAYLLLGRLQYDVRRSDQAVPSTLDNADAMHTTYLLAAPNAPAEDAQKSDYDAIERFLRRGGRVIATGYQGAFFLPEGRAGRSNQFVGELCNTVPEGHDTLAQVGSVATFDAAPWIAPEPLARVDAMCGADAMLVHRDYDHGGRMIYLASSEPFSNRGLRQDTGLHLLLLAVGPAGGSEHRTVIFDEFYHGTFASSSDYLKGLPLRSLTAQAGLLLLLLMFSYTRRSGPIREPLRVPRASPLEFALSMGALYEHAGASQPATEAAHRRLLRFLEHQFGLPPKTVRRPPAELASLVASRVGIDGGPLQQVLDRADAARYERLRPRDALALVRALDAEAERLGNAIAQQQRGRVETK